MPGSRARREDRASAQHPVGHGRLSADSATLVLDQGEYADAATEARPTPAPGEAGRKRPRKDPEADRPTVPVGSAVTVAPLAMEGFELPPLTMLARSTHTAAAHQATDKELRALADKIVRTLMTFEIPAESSTGRPGPP